MKLATTRDTRVTSTKDNKSGIVSSGVGKLSFQAEHTQITPAIPPEISSMFASLGSGIGIDLSSPENWTLEAINLIQGNKVKFQQAMEWLPIVEETVGVFLKMQVEKAEFYGRICKQMFASKKKVDKASAQMLVDLFSYQKHGERLSQQVQRKQQLIEKRSESISKMQEDELTNAIAYLNVTEELHEVESGRRLEVQEESAKVLSDFRNQKVERRAQAKVGHLNSLVT